MYIKRGIQWSQMEVCPGTNNEERGIEGVTYKHTSGNAIMIKGVVSNTGDQQLNGEMEQTIIETSVIIIRDLNLRIKELNKTTDEGLRILAPTPKERPLTLWLTPQSKRPTSAKKIKAQKTTSFYLLDKTSVDKIRAALERFKNQKALGPDQIKGDGLKLGGDTFFAAYKPIAITS
ncbi:hypothetical protein EVAR_30761_1 [Eumeta japonica]|uniref:Uncharacterized protein n=1 Tax=Eumeta variegata TaxID=151549 RepID=A0A4C1V5U6_EUMVA|nr:hypothetical protein EVAR_30761_1 [Eumeta japonica]